MYGTQNFSLICPPFAGITHRMSILYIPLHTLFLLLLLRGSTVLAEPRPTASHILFHVLSDVS
jgi:hypothetical protein